jgi:hypothetical protein
VNGRAVLLLEMADHMEATDIGHAEVDDRDVGRCDRRLRHRTTGIVCGDDLEASSGKTACELATDHFIVIDD